jgi:hypothetical protein
VAWKLSYTSICIDIPINDSKMPDIYTRSGYCYEYIEKEFLKWYLIRGMCSEFWAANLRCLFLTISVLDDERSIEWWQGEHKRTSKTSDWVELLVPNPARATSGRMSLGQRHSAWVGHEGKLDN